MNSGGNREAGGLRRSGLNVLTDDEIAFVVAEAKAIDADLNIFNFNPASGFTGYRDSLDIIDISRSVYPDEYSDHNRDRMSVRAVLAHEYYGHRLNTGKFLPYNSWLDEFRASMRASRLTPNLTDEDRASLLIDAYDRAKEAGVSLKMNKLALKYIYGLE